MCSMLENQPHDLSAVGVMHYQLCYKSSNCINQFVIQSEHHHSCQRHSLKVTPPRSDRGQESFNSKSLALQAQKKILSKMATMVVANLLTDDTSSEILDELYRASREYTKSKKEAHKIIKDVIKIALKIGILYRNHQFSPDEMETVERFKKKMNQAAMTVVSFYEVEYTFDRGILSELLMECRDLLHELVEHHLTARSHARIDHVFNHFADVDFLTELYGPSEDYRLNLRKICDGINKLLDEGTL
ncbi:Tumor necrosis factor alpha-induced protein 8-like protein 3 [Labeo rohita]|uniref:Tumor necrosis factor alpha-induced protein 8-like protein 3 n=1 Tax=Labeo rohita TaxID=84645 RepID=A0ABQ8LTL3_LABRO|nr:Tumor necrosis factor alpha-induced protein 8-like protein 3 [Labeo rohita]